MPRESSSAGSPIRSAPVGKGSSGQEGTGIAVTDVAVHDGKVYATDAFQVFVFTTEGEFVEQFGKPGTLGGRPRPPERHRCGRGRHDLRVRLQPQPSDRLRRGAARSSGRWASRSGEIAEQVEHTFGLPRGLAVLDDGSILVVDAFEFELVRILRLARRSHGTGSGA